MPNDPARKSRYERRSRPQSLAPVIALAILAAGIAYAQQNLPVPPAKAPAPAAPAPADATGTQGDAAPASGADRTSDGTKPAAPSAAKGSPQHFEPTEKVRPDFDVAFPVDI